MLDRLTMPAVRGQRDDSKERAAPLTRSAPTVSLPNGGGVIRGIDEKLSINPATGTGAITVAIFASPGRADSRPNVVEDCLAIVSYKLK